MLQDDTYSQIYYIIDDLDVYQKLMNDFIIRLIKIFDSRKKVESSILKFLCTTREIKVVLNSWENLSRRILRCSLDNIDIFIRSRIEFMKDEDDFTSKMRKMTTKQLLKKTEMTFLWLDVIIRKILSIDYFFIDKIEDVISNSSEELDRLYCDLIKDAIKKNDISARLLALVVYAQSSLSLKALKDAMNINLEDRYICHEQYFKKIVNLTSKMIRNTLDTLLDVVKDKIYLIHQIVKDYLKRLNSLQIFINIQPRLFLAHVFMIYLSLKDFDRSEWQISRHIDQYSLFRYATSYWYFHIEIVADIRCNPSLQIMLKIILSSNNHKKRVEMYNEHENENEDKDPSFSRASDIAIHFDIGWLAELLLSRKTYGIRGVKSR